jgi:hypothetical protein
MSFKTDFLGFLKENECNINMNVVRSFLDQVIDADVEEVEGEGTAEATDKVYTPDTNKVYTKFTVKTDPNLISTNIKNGVTIFGVEGTYTGPEPEPET